MYTVCQLLASKISPSFMFTFVKQGIQRDRRVYAYNISLFDSNHFKLPVNRLFRMRFQMFVFLTKVSCVCRKDCVQIVERCTFMNGGNFEADNLASDVFMSKLICAHSSNGKSFQHVPVR